MKSIPTTQDAQWIIKVDKIKRVKESSFRLRSPNSNEEDNNVL